MDMRTDGRSVNKQARKQTDKHPNLVGGPNPPVTCPTAQATSPPNGVTP